MDNWNKKYGRRDSQGKDTLDMANGGLVPPQAIDAEEAVLGAMMTDPSVVDGAMEMLSADCFYLPRHQIIFKAMASLYHDRIAIDMIALTDKLKEQDRTDREGRSFLEEIGGVPVLASLTSSVGSSAHVEYYMMILKQERIRRELIRVGHDIVRMGYDESLKTDDLMINSQDEVYQVIAENNRVSTRKMSDVLNEAIEEIQESQKTNGPTGIPSGYPELDYFTSGWQKGNLIILAARPGAGKTAFALNLAANAAVRFNYPVAFFSLEMRDIELAKRLVSIETGIDGGKIKGSEKFEEYDWAILEEGLKGLAKAPLFLDETPSMPLKEFRTKAKDLVARQGVKLIIVDYLQLMTVPDEQVREQQVARVSRELKATAKELEVPVIALAQLSRAVQTRQSTNGKPILSDLRESGSIEQDADIVMFIHRPDYMGLSEHPEDRDLAYIIIAKNRNGATDDVPLTFRKGCVKFLSLSDSLTEVASRMNDSI